ncbi:hypothetical protein [Chryseobacterium sp. GP-SGM7]|uniref:hypothetical protein n=1 Tax=Chryseobacterium sp. GP-SGM7 TaxID=3411323 RepID=UPI003B9275D6
MKLQTKVQIIKPKIRTMIVTVKIENILKEKGFKNIDNVEVWSDLQKSLNLK